MPGIPLPVASLAALAALKPNTLTSPVLLLGTARFGEPTTMRSPEASIARAYPAWSPLLVPVIVVPLWVQVPELRVNTVTEPAVVPGTSLSGEPRAIWSPVALISTAQPRVSPAVAPLIALPTRVQVVPV